MVKIFGTLGPSCSSFEVLKAMYGEGMSGIRLNLSHSSLQESRCLLDTVKRAAEAAGRKPGILIDMQGPELRLGKLSDNVFLIPGQVIPAELLPLPASVSDSLSAGDRLLIDDGKLLLRCVDSSALEVINGGAVMSRKSVAIEGRELYAPPVTDADYDNLSFSAGLGIEYIMQPFVRGKDDLDALKNAMTACKSESLKIFAKIENRTGYEKLNEIIPRCDEVVIARGDLGNAFPLWKLPAVQKEISGKCLCAGRPFTVVTQMLASMENSPVPTRAEVSDIFNAVLDGAASVMVTGETAVGKYPVEVVKYLYKTVCEAQAYLSRL